MTMKRVAFDPSNAEHQRILIAFVNYYRARVTWSIDGTSKKVLDRVEKGDYVSGRVKMRTLTVNNIVRALGKSMDDLEVFQCEALQCVADQPRLEEKVVDMKHYVHKNQEPAQDSQHSGQNTNSPSVQGPYIEHLDIKDNSRVALGSYYENHYHHQEQSQEERGLQEET